MDLNFCLVLVVGVVAVPVWCGVPVADVPVALVVGVVAVPVWCGVPVADVPVALVVGVVAVPVWCGVSVAVVPVALVVGVVAVPVPVVSPPSLAETKAKGPVSKRRRTRITNFLIVTR